MIQTTLIIILAGIIGKWLYKECKPMGDQYDQIN